MSLLADCGQEIQPYADGGMVRALKAETLRAEFFKQHLADGADDKEGAKRRAYNHAVKAAQNKGLIAARELGGTQFIWLATKAT